MIPRPLNEVIDATLKIIPKDLPHRADLEATLNAIKDSYAYTAPEMTAYWWFNFIEALETFASPETYIAAQNVWVENLVKMLEGKTDYKEYL